MKKIIFLILILTILAFLKFGRSLYIPLLNKFRGLESVESISKKISKPVYERLQESLDKAGLDALPDELILVGLKEEQILEVYTKKENKPILLKQYPFTAFSGKLGPKLKEGDKQIPEGIYNIEYLNPNSSYYLSMKINYPNAFDVSKSVFSDKRELGSDIFIHGKAVTIGCIPIGDEAIEELFILVQNALTNEVKVIISPRDFRVNPAYPSIAGINWEKELYQGIEKKLHSLKK